MSTRAPLAGIYGPVVTPFDARDQLDLEAFASNISAHIASGLRGVLVAGSSGEAPLLTEDERVSLIERARDAVGDAWVFAGIGGESTKLVLERARRAATAGADAVLVVAPHYYGDAMTTAALTKHYRRVADESPVPVMLYNIPKFTHLVLDPAMVHEMARHERVIGMKDSAGDLTRLARYLEAASDDFVVLTGHAGTLKRAVELGARGAILAASLFAAELAIDVFEATLNGDDDRAAEGQARLAPLGKEIAGAMGPAGIKAAMDAVGLRGGSVRSPLLPLGPGERDRVAAMLAECGVLLGA